MQPSNYSANNDKWLIASLSTLAVQLGMTVPPERLVLYAESLRDIPREKLEPVIKKLRLEWKELTFPPVATIRELALGDEETEAYAAWEQVKSFVDRYVDCDPFGRYGPEHGWYKTWPTLTDRILQTVRMVGGWKTLKLMDYQNEPFVQKSFFAAYGHAPQVAEFPLALLAQIPEVKQLLAMPAPSPAPGPPPPILEKIGKPFPKGPTAEQTDAEFHDRKALLRQQAAKILADRKRNEPEK